MAYKVAVASTDGKVVNEHFGRAERFLIFEVEDGRLSFSELREAGPPCMEGEHSDTGLADAAGSLADCRAVLVSRIGAAAARALESAGIEALEIHGFIDEVLEKLIQYYSTIDGGKRNVQKA